MRDYASILGNRLGAPAMELTHSTDVASLSGEFLFLHFSGYGFQKRGIPLWLVSKIRSLRTRFKAFGIVFHELFATGPPWGSAFWLSGCQRRIARELLSLADFWLVSGETYAHWLLKQAHDTPHRVLPVFSTVGEPVSTGTERERKLVVFGSGSVRARAYEWADGEIFRCAQRHGLEIHDIGTPLPKGPLAQRLAQEGVIARGMLPAEEVSLALSRASYGALAYPTRFVSKSSIFAAYCAHGICPLLLSKTYDMHDGLKANVHYAAGIDALDRSIVDPRTIGGQARQWYEQHDIEAHVVALKTMTTEVRR
ncbi:hypothetical protein SRS16CHR_04059 [Variovorax sp. SRS16]|nr:hypothetical protein SRS16CHR_04059 [Variovorax sp. SRS16]